MLKIIIIIAAILCISGSIYAGNMGMGMDMRMSDNSGAGSAQHYLLIDGAGHYLLIDGANHKLRIDGAS